jgi:hypothetical protein
MKHSMMALMILALTVPVWADDPGDDPQYDQGRDRVYAPAARFRYVDRTVTLQRASEDSSEEAQANVPFLPGDRMSTDDNGRAELQLPSGTLLRVDDRSSLEYLSEGGPAAFRLDGGGLYVHAREGGALTIETPGGLISLGRRGVFRIDADSGETRLTVLEGSAVLDSGGRQVEVQAGERTYANSGEAPEDPQGFNRGDRDDFARWDGDRDSRVGYYGGDSQRYLPAEIASYGGDLDGHGSWYDDPEAGHVWRPNVGEDWSPYSDGRWEWTSYGWTWCPYESWGWAPFHYGRWGFGARLGWYWIPGPVWGPAWVSWAYGGDYVGWCPLGFHNRPVLEIGIFGGRYGRNAWFYARRGDLLTGEFARRRVSATPNVVSALRVASPGLQPTRDVRSIHAMPTPTARLRAQAAPLGSRAVIRGTAPNNRDSRAFSRTIPQTLSRPRLDPQSGAVHPTDRRGSRGPVTTPSERALPRSQAGRSADISRGAISRPPDARRFNSAPSSDVRRNETATRRVDPRGAYSRPSAPWATERVAPPSSNSRNNDSAARRVPNSWDRSYARPSAPRAMERTAPPSSDWRRNETAPRRGTDSWDRGSSRPSAPSAMERAVPQQRYVPPPRQQSMPRSEAVRPPRMDGGNHNSQSHYSAPHSAERSAPRPSSTQRDRRRPDGR